jgi:putative AlgH/UPF0301 family transcriptional regulator
VNKNFNSDGKSATLKDVLRPLPADLMKAFGGSIVKEGGPVNMSLQMLHSTTPDQDELKIGGQNLPMVTAEDDESTAIYSDRAVYYKGDIISASNAVLSGLLDRNDVSFFVGASVWTTGQLENEIERGSWLPCRGPPEIAHTGICEHDPSQKGGPRPKADLWLSMMTACGYHEGELAHLFYDDDAAEDALGDPCDEV